MPPGYALLGALAFAMAFIYAQVTVNDFVIARYTADQWRARVYAVRYFITYLISGAAISMIAFLHSRGGFDLVLTVDGDHRHGIRDRTRAWRCWSTASNAISKCAAGGVAGFRTTAGARSTTLAPVARPHDLGDAGAVAAILVALVAEQAHRLPDLTIDTSSSIAAIAQAS